MRPPSAAPLSSSSAARRLAACGAVAALLVAAGCDPPPPTFARDVGPILQARCTACHQQGGHAPFPLVAYDDVAPIADLVNDAVASRRMPPWFAGPGCNEYAHDRALSDEEIATIAAWVDAGAPRGEPIDDAAADAEAAAPPAPGLPRVDVVLDTEGPYTPVQRDDYRCFTLPLPIEGERFIRGYDFLAGNPAIVHHVNVFLTTAASAPRFVQRQEADDLPGYDCSMGTMEAGSALVGSWAPGAQGVLYPDESGILVEPGAALVLEIHYNIDGREGEQDSSSLMVMLEEQVARRGLGGGIYDFLNWPAAGGMAIPAGDDDVMHTFELDPAPYVEEVAPWLQSDRIRIHIVGLHMHYLGKSASMWVRKPDENVCLLDIPRWDFEWQMGYELKEPVEFVVGQDTLYLECHWDNSAENQPIVNGERQQVADRDWGTGTTDEMCLGLFYVTAAD